MTKSEKLFERAVKRIPGGCKQSGAVHMALLEKHRDLLNVQKAAIFMM